VDEYANGINKGVAILFWLHAGPFVLVYVLARKAITSRLANFLNRSA
jgi:hypothetical protein